MIQYHHLPKHTKILYIKNTKYKRQIKNVKHNSRIIHHHVNQIMYIHQYTNNKLIITNYNYNLQMVLSTYNIIQTIIPIE